MNERLRQIVSPFLALLVLLSTVSWSVEKHLCMGRVTDIAFFHHADSCGMEEGMEAMGLATDAMDCCDDEAFTIEGQDDLKITWEDLSGEQQTFVTVFGQVFLLQLHLASEQVIAKTDYPPPLLVYDLQLLHEVYLI